MDDGLGSNFTTVIDTVNAPTLTQVVVTSYSNQSSIEPGRPYRFRVSARVFNGFSPVSPNSVIYACDNPS